ncbi:MAG: hypothetical protein OHK93_007894 [Ramalina farinacea]|uniref:Uncharacterized protein n=1 Tax=Ramalina farinacea TaxID=258253 RepID=A0AA43QN28_9LECA|nr:hypothetical protein [Ramalina farinacea]
MHLQQSASELNHGEYPATAAMTTGYVFRVENQATVSFLQNIGSTGRLTTVNVRASPKRVNFSDAKSVLGLLLYVCTVLMTLAAVVYALVIADWWVLIAFLCLMVSRFINIKIFKDRAVSQWYGAKEPGVNGDLLVLLSQDRWIRLKGPVDALKAVTSGRWLRDMTRQERSAENVAKMLVYACAAIPAPNATSAGNLALVCVLLGSALLLGCANMLINTETLFMHDCVLAVKERSKQYVRRLDLSHELIKETGRDDWARQLGMIKGDAVNVTM